MKKFKDDIEVLDRASPSKLGKRFSAFFIDFILVLLVGSLLFLGARSILESLPSYKENREKIISNAKKLGLDINIFNSDIFNIVNTNSPSSPCYLCARMRRGFLYARAQELGCNKIALGHHFDDAIETIMLSIFYGGEYKGMMPKLKSTNFAGMELIRPLYLVRESSIINWAQNNDLHFINCACQFTSKESTKDSKRLEMKNLIKKLEVTNKNIAYNIFKSSENVNIDTVLGTKINNEKHSFLENYNKN